MSAEEQPEAFVIMPFAEEHYWVYRDVIVPPLTKSGYKTLRMDEEDHVELISKRIVENILSADLIVAVITGLRPNVMYELGICHTLGKPTVVLLEESQTLPFDLNQVHYISYPKQISDDLEENVSQIQQKIQAVADQLNARDLDSGNPVSPILQNPLDHIYRVNPLDVLQSAAEDMSRLISVCSTHADKIETLVDQIPSFSEDDGFFKFIANLSKSIVFGLIGIVLIRDIFANLETLQDRTRRFCDHVTAVANASRPLIDYKQDLFRVKTVLATCKSDVEDVTSLISATITYTETSRHKIDNDLLRSISLLTQLNSVIGWDVVTFLFGSQERILEGLSDEEYELQSIKRSLVTKKELLTTLETELQQTLDNGHLDG